MKRILYLTLLLLGAGTVLAQTAPLRYGEEVRYFLQHSNLYHALEEASEAQARSVLAGSLLENPAVDFGYYGGSPSDIGRRWDLSVTQKLPLPSAYKAQKTLRDAEFLQALNSHDIAYHEFVLQVQNLCADHLYWKSHVGIQEKNLENAAAVMELYEKRLAAGDCSILEYNQARLNWAQIEKELQLSQIELRATESQLRTLNNGEPYKVNLTAFPPVLIPDSNDATLREVQNRYQTLATDLELGVAKAQEKVAHTQWLPDIEVGYASENTVGETFRGATIGLELPLWHNRRNVQITKIQQEAIQSRMVSQEQQLQTQYQTLYQKLVALAASLQSLQEIYAQNSSAELLMTALQAGEMSLESFLRQQEIRTHFEHSILETQYELEKTFIAFESYHQIF